MTVKDNFVFLGGIFPDRQTDFILKNSLGVIQNAADALQKNFIRGLGRVSDCSVCIINLPFVSSYPRAFKRFFFPSCLDDLDGKIPLIGCGFLNVFLLRFFSRFVSAVLGLNRVADSSGSVLFVYSAHLPFVFAALLKRLLNPSLKICLIVPDLPEYMGGRGLTNFLFGNLNTKLFYCVVGKFDYFVVLTECMISRLGVDHSKAIVIEGIVEAESPAMAECVPDRVKKNAIKSVLYSGTLAARYGIRDLVDAFNMLKEQNIELLICGDGDSREYVKAAALRDRRIIYLGQLERNEVLKLQRNASILVNPRRPEGIYTKYSFPSKVLEYMASGRPVVMYKLDGIPDAYSPYYISPEDVGVEGLMKCLQNVIAMNEDNLYKLGNSAREFVLREKSPESQVKKVLNVICGDGKC